MFGFLYLLAGPAIVVTTPLLQPLRLGYLLEASSRVARSGHLPDGFSGLSRACA